MILDLLPFLAGTNIHMWFTFAVIILAVYLFGSERYPVVISGFMLLGILLAFFELVPMLGPDGEVLLAAESLLSGFSNPALIAVVGLLVIGQAVIRSGSLNDVTSAILRLSRFHPKAAIVAIIVAVVFLSGFINDTPTCVMFIPVIIAVARHLKLNTSKVLMPLSYAAILGGTLTLIGSSTNLLVSGMIVSLGLPALGFFDFTIPALVIAAVGIPYILLVMPRLLPDRAPMADEVIGDSNRQFVAQIELSIMAEWVGQHVKETIFGKEGGIPLKMLQRREHAYLPPFDDDLVFQAGDVLVVNATRQMLTDMLAKTPGESFRRIHQMSLESGMKGDDATIAELLVAPASRMVGQTIAQVGFHSEYNCIVLGIQRRSRIITSRMTDIRLTPGDVLLIIGNTPDVMALRDDRDLILMEWSARELPSRRVAWLTNLIFFAVIALSALNIVPIHIGAFIGGVLVVMLGCLSNRQALRAIDSQIIAMVAAGIAISQALESTGGAAFLAAHLVTALDGVGPTFTMSALFGLMAIMTNVLSNNATALLFTPIAVGTAQTLGVPPEMFIYAVIFASNCCSFATPIGYQTNLLVMAPGHYTFNDYLRAGLPLVALVWITYTTFSWFYFGHG